MLPSLNYMLYIFTGDGKGKTTASLGQALRAVGNEKKVLMIQFIKGPWKSGEDKSHKKLLPDFEIRKRGRGFVGIESDKLPRQEHEKAAEDALREASRELDSGRWNMLILDELNVALDMRILSIEPVLELIQKAREKDVDLVLTGRGKNEVLVKEADLVTEMIDIKHPFKQGESARRGIEY